MYDQVAATFTTKLRVWCLLSYTEWNAPLLEAAIASEMLGSQNEILIWKRTKDICVY